MENAVTAGLAKQIVLARALETTANNVANQTTSGFKSDHIAFREYLAAVDPLTSGDPVISLVVDPDTYTDFSAGGMEQSYRDLDFAIDGDGFFAIETAAGVRYTRDGLSIAALPSTASVTEAPQVARVSRRIKRLTG